MPEDELVIHLDRLVEEGLLDRSKSGLLTLHDWETWQPISDNSAARVQKHRAEKRAQKHPVTNVKQACNVTETLPKRYGNGEVTARERFRSDQIRSESDQNREEETDKSVSLMRHTETTPDVASPDLTRLRAYVDQVTGGAWGHLAGQWTRAKPYLVESWLAAWSAVATMDPMPNKPWHYVARIIADWPGNVPPAAPAPAAKQTTTTATNFDPTPEELARWEAIEREAS
jgi:hypothetical protein